MTRPEADAEYLRKMRAHARFAEEYFSQAHRVDRERDVARALLRALGVAFDAAEITAPRPEPVDVAFRDARFQICYRPEAGGQVHREWKLRRKRADQARSIGGANRHRKGIPAWTGETTPMTLSELTIMVTETLEPKARHYGAQGCAELDALVYADLTRTRSLAVDSAPGDTLVLAGQGWRSVAVVFEPVGMVLCARDDAPGFLKHVAGTPLWRWTDPDGLFAR